MDRLFLQQGSHESGANGYCAMELSSYLAGEPHATNGDVVLCAICVEPITEAQESTLYHVRANDAAQLAHTTCAAANLARIVDAVGRFGTGRMGRALRLDR